MALLSAVSDEALVGALVIPHGVIVAAAIFLGTAAIALAWPVPVALSRASWPMRMPVIALLLWQAIGLAGGLSMIGALALAGYSVAPRHPWVALIPAAAFTVYLLAHLAVTVVQQADTLRGTIVDADGARVPFRAERIVCR